MRPGRSQLGRGCVGVELGGTSGYRVGRGRCYRPWAVERLSVEPALPLRVPLHCTASRRVHALRTLSSGHRQRAWQCLGRNTSGFQDTSAGLLGLAFCRRVAGFPPRLWDGCLTGGACRAGVGGCLAVRRAHRWGCFFPGMRLHFPGVRPTPAAGGRLLAARSHYGSA